MLAVSDSVEVGTDVLEAAELVEALDTEVVGCAAWEVLDAWYTDSLSVSPFLTICLLFASLSLDAFPIFFIILPHCSLIMDRE